MARILSLLPSPDFSNKAIFLLQALRLMYHTYLEIRFMWPLLMPFPPISSFNFAFLCISLYFILLQLVALAFLFLHLFLSSFLLSLIAIHLLLIASILVQLIQLLSLAYHTEEWFCYLSVCITFTLYSAILFSASRSPKLSASITPAPSRTRRNWIPPTDAHHQQQNHRRLDEYRPLVEENL